MTEPSLSFESNILPEEIRNEFKATESSEVNAECEELPDEEGLMSSYDCIILGTGLAESIVACALSRSGKTVLHLDKKDVYGGEAPSFNLTEFLSYCKEKKVHWETKYNAEGFNSASETKTVNGSIIKLFQEPQLAQCVQINDSTDAVADDHKNQAHICISSRSIYSKQSSRIHPSCFGYVMDRSTSSLPSKSSPESSATHPAFSGYLPNHVITPRRALFSSRHFCIDSGFRMLLASPSDATVKSLRDSDVPSSKSDIFATTALTALEKRALMKFLQFTLDRGQFLHGGDNAVLDLNERELAIGRSLKRPQSTYTAAGVEANALLVHDEEDFMQYLNSQRLSPRLQGIIMHSLCFYPTTSSIKTGEALNRLQTSIDSIGIYGNTPFLIPMYGYSELCQAFCRMCAVWGGIYMLRRGVSEVHIDPLLSMPLNNNATECAESGACMSIRDSSGKTIKCKHFITNASYWPQAPKQSTIMVSRVSICSDKVLLNDLSLCVIPPHTAGLDNSHAINIVQVDASVNVLPDIYVGNLKNSKPVILYLSTGLLGNLQDTDSVMLLQSASLLMSKVMQLLQSKNNSSSMSLFANCNELFGATFVRPLYAIGNQFKQQRPTSIPSNVHLTGETCGDMDCSAAFQLAKEIFEQICPGEVFLLNMKKENVAETPNDVEDEEAYLARVLEECIHKDAPSLNNEET